MGGSAWKRLCVMCLGLYKRVMKNERTQQQQ